MFLENFALEVPGCLCRRVLTFSYFLEFFSNFLDGPILPLPLPCVHPIII